MAMQSSNLLPALQELPGGESGEHKSFRDHITGIVNMDSGLYAAEFSSAVSTGLWFIFDDRNIMGINIPGTGLNVDDNLREAMTKAREVFPSDPRTLLEHWQDVGDLPAMNNVFMNPFKGKIAEFLTKQQLESAGWTDVTLAPDLDQKVVDIIGVNPDGYITAVQSKFGKSYSANDVQELMSVKTEEVRPVMEEILSHPDVNVQGIMPQEPELHLSLGDNIVAKASEAGIDVSDKLVAEISTDFLDVDGPTDALNTLSSNLGIDIPDSVVGIIPYAATIMAGARLLVSVIKTEKQFKAADRTTRNKIQVVQTLTLMSRMGVTTVLSTAGGVGGGSAGTVVPGVGNLIGGIAGSIAGAGMSMYLNKRLQPRMLDLALDITGLTNDDLFYYKNKPRIDTVALSFRSTAGELVASTAR